MLSCISIYASRRLFLSAPLLQITVLLCLPSRECHGTSMSHRENLGCGRFPSSKMIRTSWTCRRQKCTLIAVRVPSLPGQPSTGHSLVPPLVENSVRYVCGSPPPPVAALVQLHLSSFAFPCYIIRWLPVTLTPSPSRSPRNRPTLLVSCDTAAPPPSSCVHTPPPTGCLLLGTVCMSYLPSCPHLCKSPRVQINRLAH